MRVFRTTALAVIMAFLSVPAFPDAWLTYQNVNNILDMAVDGDTVWMTLEKGGILKWKYPTGMYTRYDRSNGLVDENVQRIFKDREGRIWAPNGTGVSCFENGEWKYLGPGGGATLERVTSIAEDGNGVLWFGTGDQGVWSYDGTEWTRHFKRKYQIVQSITSIITDNNGQVWATRIGGNSDDYSAARKGGVIRFDGKSWSVFATKDNGLADYGVFSIARDSQGRMWAGTSNGLSMFDGATWKTIEGTTTGERINDIAVDREGTVWFVTYNHIWKVENGKAVIVEYGSFLTIAVDSNGVKWFGSGGKGILRLDGGNETWYGVADGLSHNTVNDLAFDREGVLYAATSGGVSSFDGKEWKIMSSFSATAVAVDQAGDVWIGAAGNVASLNGVYKYHDENWEHFTAPGPVTASTIRSVAIDSTGGVWVGMAGGVGRLIGSQWEYYSPSNTVVDDVIVQVVVDADNRKWFVTSGDWILSYDDHFWNLYSDSSLSGMTSIGIESSGLKWIATHRWLYTFNENPPIYKSNFIEYPSTKYPPGKNFFQDIAVDSHDVKWFTTAQTGIFSLAGEKWTHYTMSDGLADSVITRIIIGEDQSVWACSKNGISRFIDEKWNTFRISNNGPNSNTISSVAVDSANAKWFGTGVGVSRLRNGVWNHYSQADGLPEGDAALVATGADGMVWAGFSSIVFYGTFYSGGGLSRFDGEKWTNFFLNRNIDRVIEDREGVLWVAHSEPLTIIGSYYVNHAAMSILKNQSWSTVTLSTEISSKTFQVAAVDKNNVKWFELMEHAVEGKKRYIYSYDGEQFTRNSDPDIVRLLSSGVSDHIWFSSADGKVLTRYDGTEWKKFTPPFPFAATGSLGITAVMDRKNVTWFGTRNGLVSFDGETWKVNEYPASVANTTRALVVDKDNTKWVCTTYGIAAFFGDPLAVRENTVQPGSFSVSAFPNPFNPSTTITYTLPSPGKATLVIYDVTGRKVRELAAGNLPTGTHRAVWDGRDAHGAAVASGIFFVRVVCGKRTATGKMLLVR